MFGQKHTTVTRGKMSRAYGDDIRDVNLQNNWGNPETVKSPLQGQVTVRSSWEGAVIRYFSSKGTKYLYEPTAFSLQVNGVKTSYRPDFLILLGPGVEEEFYLEVKGVWNEAARTKVEAAIKAGYNLVVWEGKDLQEKGILDNSFRPCY